MKSLDEAARAAADAKFKLKEKRRTEAQQAVAEYEAAQRAVDERTDRLRTLRLARDSTAPGSSNKKSA